MTHSILIIRFALQKNIGEVKADEFPASHLPAPEGSLHWGFRGLTVATEMQGRGLGKKLMTACEHAIEARGGEKLDQTSGFRLFLPARENQERISDVSGISEETESLPLSVSSGRLLWCFARATNQPYYVKQGFAPTGDALPTEAVGPIRRLFKYL